MFGYKVIQLDKMKLVSRLAMVSMLLSVCIAVLTITIDIVAMPISRAYFFNLRLTGRILIIIFDTILLIITIGSIINFILSLTIVIKYR